MHKFVIPSPFGCAQGKLREAKSRNLLSAGKREVLRFAQDDAIHGNERFCYLLES
jgi:hypothetical protein